MVIEIPAFLFAQTTARTSAPGETGDEIGKALAEARSSEREILQLSHGLGLVGQSLQGGGEARQQLAAARRALGLQGENGAFRWLLEHADADLARRETASARGKAVRSLMGAVKAVATLPVGFAEKAEVGRTLLQQGIQRGLIAAEDQELYEGALRSELILRQAQTAIAQAAEPGEALSILAAAQSDGGLLPSDGELLGRQAEERDAVAAARHRARLAWKEQDDLAAFGRGELPEPLSEEILELIHGGDEAAAAYARYQAAREAAEAMSLIRGRDAQAIADERANWTGTPAAFDTAVQNDEAWRRRDPAGYALATVPGAKAAWAEAPEEERRAVLWSAQAAAGIPEDQISPWTLAEEEAIADEWAALPDGYGGRNEKLAFFRKHILSLPVAQRSAAIARMTRQGIVDGTEAELARLLDRLDGGQVNEARRFAAALTPSGSSPPAGSASAEGQKGAKRVVTDKATFALLHEGDGPEVTASDPSPATPNAGASAARERKAVVEAVARIRHPDNLILLIPRLRRAFEHDPAALAILEAQARELAAHPSLPQGQGGGEFPPGFADWAGKVGYYRDAQIVAAADNVAAAGYDVQILEDGRLGIVRPGEGDVLAVLPAKTIAELNLSKPEELVRLKLELDVLSQALPLDELLTAAEAIDPSVSSTTHSPRGGSYESTRPSETAELLRLADEALANGADPDDVAIALHGALFPPSDWETAAELVIALSPLGVLQDGVEAAEAVGVLLESDDEDARSAAWDTLLITAGSYAAGAVGTGVARIVRGSRALGRSALKTLADVQGLKRKERLRMADDFYRNALAEPKVGAKVDEILGQNAWTSLPERTRKSIAGDARRLIGGLAEDVGFVAAEARLVRDGWTLFDRNLRLTYNGRRLNIDIVALRPGAAPVAADGLNTIATGGVHYRIADLQFIDVKFGSSRLTEPQRRAVESSAGRFEIVLYKPLFADLPPAELVKRLNASPHVRNAKPPVVFTTEMMHRYAGIAENATTIEESLQLLLLAALTSGHLANQLAQPAEHP